MLCVVGEVHPKLLGWVLRSGSVSPELSPREPAVTCDGKVLQRH